MANSRFSRRSKDWLKSAPNWAFQMIQSWSKLPLLRHSRAQICQEPNIPARKNGWWPTTRLSNIPSPGFRVSLSGLLGCGCTLGTNRWLESFERSELQHRSGLVDHPGLVYTQFCLTAFYIRNYNRPMRRNTTSTRHLDFLRFCKLWPCLLIINSTIILWCLYFCTLTIFLTCLRNRFYNYALIPLILFLHLDKFFLTCQPLIFFHCLWFAYIYQ